jgi:pectinesterase
MKTNSRSARIAGLAALFVCGGACLAQAKTITVAADGSGDFKTVQEAIAAAPENGSERTILHIKAGTYHGPMVVPKNKPNLTFEGDDTEKTVLTYDKNVRDPIPAGIDKFNPALQVQADGFRADKLTIENTSGDHGQALALRMDADRGIVTDCRITGWQDTLMVNNGRDYFKDDYIEGRVDFIYGSATAVFDHCEIHSKNGGHITAASTPQDHPFGFVFMDCKLTGDAIPWNPATTNPSTTQKPKVTPQADLGRPWRPYASVTYINCEMGSHIKPEGWNNWRKASNEQTARYSEYHSHGPGAAPDRRAAWSHQLTDEQASRITVQSVLGGQDHWDPAAELHAH